MCAKVEDGDMPMVDRRHCTKCAADVSFSTGAARRQRLRCERDVNVEFPETAPDYSAFPFSETADSRLM